MKVEYALIAMEGPALHWIQWLSSESPILSWKKITVELLRRYGDDPRSNPWEMLALGVTGVSRPYKQAEFEIIFGEGVSKLGCILDCAEMIDVVLRKGSWYSYGDHRLGQGRERALLYLRENPLLSEEIEKRQRLKTLSWMGVYHLDVHLGVLITLKNDRMRKEYTGHLNKVRAAGIENIGQVGSCVKSSALQPGDEDMFQEMQ
ncbi:hypothetical protein OROMI_022726 [Orobanche minor]